MKKIKEYVIRAYSTENLVNECPKCFSKITLRSFIGLEEGSGKWNGEKIYLNICPGCSKVLFHVPFGLVFDIERKGMVLPKEKMDGEYKLLKI